MAMIIINLSFGKIALRISNELSITYKIIHTWSNCGSSKSNSGHGESYAPIKNVKNAETKSSILLAMNNLSTWGIFHPLW